MGTYTRTSAPATEPVTTAEAKTHLRVDISDDDTYIDALVAAARQWCETFTNRGFITQTWTYTDTMFRDGFTLYPSPASAVTYIKYYDADNTLQTLSTDVYQVDTTGVVTRISLKPNQVWPVTYDGIYNAVVVTYTAGYGAASSVPEGIKHAIKFLVGHWYATREAVNIGNIVTQVPLSVESLLYSFKVPWQC